VLDPIGWAKIWAGEFQVTKSARKKGMKLWENSWKPELQCGWHLAFLPGTFPSVPEFSPQPLTGTTETYPQCSPATGAGLSALSVRKWESSLHSVTDQPGCKFCSELLPNSCL
jgi:hypothetical protein